MGSLDEVASHRTTLARLGEIASSLYYQDTGRFPAWDRILRSGTSPDRDAALATTIWSECHGRESQGYRRRAAQQLLNSPTATVDQLMAIVVCCEDHREAAARRVLETGQILTDAQQRQMLTWVPALMGTPDTEGAKFERAVRGALLP